MGWWAGLTLALLPTDVARASSISAFPVMLACLTAGTVAWLDAANSRRARVLGGLLLGFGILAHLSAAYYVAALFAVSALIGGRGYLKAGVVGVLLCVAVMSAEVAVYHFAFDDALGRFRISRGQFPNPDPNVPLTIDGDFNWRFITWPIQHLIFSKGFGFILSAAIVASVARYRKLTPRERILLVTALFYWLWVSFGSVIPWAYSPFWRMMRFVEPVTLPVVVLFASAVAYAAHRRLATWCAIGALGAGVFILSAGGSWGQNVRISEELLAYAKSCPQQRFVTDYHTWNEMYALNGMIPPANVATLDDIDPSQLLQRDGYLVPAIEAANYDAILENPLNVARTPGFSRWLDRHRGFVVHETAPAYRMACSPFPTLRRQPWAMRKPPAGVITISVSGS
jgi:hypothetical protein